MADDAAALDACFTAFMQACDNAADLVPVGGGIDVRTAQRDATRLGMQVAGARLAMNAITAYLEGQEKARIAAEAHERAMKEMTRSMARATWVAAVASGVGALAAIAAIIVALTTARGSP